MLILDIPNISLKLSTLSKQYTVGKYAVIGKGSTYNNTDFMILFLYIPTGYFAELLISYPAVINSPQQIVQKAGAENSNFTLK